MAAAALATTAAPLRKARLDGGPAASEPFLEEAMAFVEFFMKSPFSWTESPQVA
jgi:hypothetical protein